MKESMHRCGIKLKFKSFYSRGNAVSFAATGNTKTENKALLEEVLTLPSDRFIFFNVPEIHTDGACTKKGDKAYAGAGTYWGPYHPMNDTAYVVGSQTNQRAELTAVLMAIEQANLFKLKYIHILSDSQYSIDMIEKTPEYKRRCWLTRNKNIISNKDLIMKLDESRGELKIQFSHVKAHCGILGNEEADKLAVRARLSYEKECRRLEGKPEAQKQKITPQTAR